MTFEAALINKLETKDRNGGTLKDWVIERGLEPTFSNGADLVTKGNPPVEPHVSIMRLWQSAQLICGTP